ncbi:MAG: amidohydrolase [Flavobacteriia bacterium]|nr:amidohydrolase [Flavobacteriia bacterium]
MKKVLFLFFLSVTLLSCMKEKNADIIVHNAKIFTIDSQYTIHDAMAIKNGKIIEVGAEHQILNKYNAKEWINAQQREVYPGFTDAHGHLISMMHQKLNIDLRNTNSFEEIIQILSKFKHKKKFILARGWDQSLWKNTKFPSNQELNILFPNIPVLLIRVDGHAALANEFLLKKAKIDLNTKIDGGKIIVENGKMTGLVLDNVINELLKHLPSYSITEKMDVLTNIETELLSYGITEVHEAGIERDEIDLFKKMYKQKGFVLSVYAMLMPTPQNIDFVKKNGKVSYKNLHIRSFKIVGDGSLGSRGACLKRPYHDENHLFGHLLFKSNEIEKILKMAKKYDYQVNTHAIGDSTNKLLLNLIAATFPDNKNHRCRMEHAQVLDENDFSLFSKHGVIPSVQPTHAVSDMRWAEDRLGKKRLQGGAYAYARLLKECGIIVFGTDFPVELFNPFLTIHAAVERKNKSNEPEMGFLPEQKISLKDCIKAMTIWPAFASFQENKKGSLEKGKEATFFIAYYPIETNKKFKENYSYMTFIKGKKVYSAE